jgi:hypothetical protein
MRFRPYRFKGFGNATGFVGPAMDIEQKRLDHKRRSVPMVLSREVADRATLDSEGKPSGDIVRVRGVDYRDFLRNPMLLQFHDYTRHSVGIIEGLGVDGDALKGVATLNPEGVNPDADIFWGQIAAGHHRAGSIGFLVIQAEEIGSGNGFYTPKDFQKIYLLEYSLVPVPMLQDALTESLSIDEFGYRMEAVACDSLGYSKTWCSRDGIRVVVERLAEMVARQWDAVSDVAEVPQDVMPEEPPAVTENETIGNMNEIVEQTIARLRANGGK